jgi:hypothetical protein
LLRQSVFSRLAGYEGANDVERLSVDPAMRYVVGGRGRERNAASISEMGRFETGVLTQPENLAVLAELSGRWIDHLRERRPMQEKLIEIGAKVISRARHVTFQMSEVAVPREVFEAILERIGRLSVAAATAR